MTFPLWKTFFNPTSREIVEHLQLSPLGSSASEIQANQCVMREMNMLTSVQNLISMLYLIILLNS